MSMDYTADVLATERKSEAGKQSEKTHKKKKEQRKQKNEEPL